MNAFRIDTRIAATAIVALGLAAAAAAPQRAAAQGAPDCKLWSQLEAAVKAVDLKAAAAAERAIDEEPDCSHRAVAAKKAMLNVYRAQDARMEKANAAPKDRLAQLESGVKKYAKQWKDAWDIHVKMAELQRKLPGKQDHAKISTAYDRALVAIDEMPEGKRPPKAEIGRLARLVYQFEALSDTPLKLEGKLTRAALGSSGRQIDAVFVPAPLQFEYDKAELTLRGQAQAQILLAQLKDRKMPELQLVGHTDPVGSFEYNDELSLRRAAAIKKFLVDNGYPPGKIAVKGRGKRDAALLKIEDRTAFTEAQIHQMLRRVELKFND
jgi:outer membrane protein OmpA-like peptidoglycan-associated protein